MIHLMQHEALAMIDYEDVPAVLVLADTREAAERGRALAEEAGCRVGSAVADLSEAAARLDEQIVVDAVFLELERDGGAAMDAILDRLEIAARTGRHGSVISASSDLIDVVAARTFNRDIIQLVDASEDERRFALGEASSRAMPMLHDVGKSRPPVRLQQLSEEVGRIANILATLSDNEPSGLEPGATEDQITSAQVRGIIRARRLRDQYFGADLFADPAWDMLLDLMAARLERQRVAVSSLCIASAVPATTALRWIKALTEQGLFVRAADPQDGRRVYIELSETAAAALAAYLRAAQRISPFLS